MNINQLIRKLKDHLGLTKYLKTSYDDKALYDIIVNHALRDWSYYFKYEYDPGVVDLKNSVIVGTDLITIPSYLTEAVKRSGLQIEDIKKIRFQNREFDIGARDTGALYSAYTNSMSSLSLYAGVSRLMNQGNVDMFSAVRFSGWFEKPNSIRMNFPINNYNFGSTSELASRIGNISLSLYVTQAPNLLGISPTREQLFFRLCKLHIMRVIYENETKYMESINSGVGNVNLKLDEWSSAGQALDELHKELSTFSVLSQPGGLTI